jgi:hypothetical protein
MSEESILARLERLERLVVEMDLPDCAIVGADYVAKLFNCPKDAVVRGRFLTNAIPRIRLKPVGFRKGDVHRVLRELKMPVQERAAEIMANAKTRRRRSIIKKPLGNS